MMNGIEAIKQQNIYRVNAINLFESENEGFATRNPFGSSLFAQQTNNDYNPNHPRVKGSETQARHLDLLA